MKKPFKKLVSTMLALSMVTTTAYVNTSFTFAAPAVGDTQTKASAIKELNVGNDIAADTYTASFTAGTDDFFTILADASTDESGKQTGTVIVEANAKTYNGVSYTQRMKTGGTGTLTARSVKFTVTEKSKVTLIAMSSSGSATREVVTLAADGTPTTVIPAVGGSALEGYDFEVEAGDVVIASKSGGLNIYGVIVEGLGGGSDPSESTTETPSETTTETPVETTTEASVETTTEAPVQKDAVVTVNAPAEVKAGENFDVSFDVTGVKDKLNNATFDITYNPDLVTPVSGVDSTVVYGDANTPLFASSLIAQQIASAKDGKIRFAATAVVNDKNTTVTSDGSLLKLTFKANAEGNAEIGLATIAADVSALNGIPTSSNAINKISVALPAVAKVAVTGSSEESTETTTTDEESTETTTNDDESTETTTEGNVEGPDLSDTDVNGKADISNIPNVEGTVTNVNITVGNITISIRVDASTGALTPVKITIDNNTNNALLLKETSKLNFPTAPSNLVSNKTKVDNVKFYIKGRLKSSVSDDKVQVANASDAVNALLNAPVLFAGDDVLALEVTKADGSVDRIYANKDTGLFGKNVTSTSKDGSDLIVRAVQDVYVEDIQVGYAQSDIKDNNNDDDDDDNKSSGSSSRGGGGSSSKAAIVKEPSTENTTTRRPSNNNNNTGTSSYRFSDIASRPWAIEAIEKLADAGIINGIGGGKFAPDAYSKRADFMIMMVKTLGLEGVVTDNFADVDANKYYANAVGLAKEAGIASGVGNNKFNPEATITRQDMMSIVARALELEGIKLDKDTSVLNKFADSSQIAAYAKEDVAALVNLGIVNGTGANLEPTALITRAQMSVIMANVYDLLNEEETTTVTEETSEETTEETTEAEETTKKSSSSKDDDETTTEETTKKSSDSKESDDETTETTTEA